MKSEIDEVALQGIEFWSNVCDEEVDLDIEATEVIFFLLIIDISSPIFTLYVNV